MPKANDTQNKFLPNLNRSSYKRVSMITYHPTLIRFNVVFFHHKWNDYDHKRVNVQVAERS